MRTSVLWSITLLFILGLFIACFSLLMIGTACPPEEEEKQYIDAGYVYEKDMNLDPTAICSSYKIRIDDEDGPCDGRWPGGSWYIISEEDWESIKLYDYVWVYDNVNSNYYKITKKSA